MLDSIVLVFDILDFHTEIVYFFCVQLDSNAFPYLSINVIVLFKESVSPHVYRSIVGISFHFTIVASWTQEAFYMLIFS